LLLWALLRALVSGAQHSRSQDEPLGEFKATKDDDDTRANNYPKQLVEKEGKVLGRVSMRVY